MVLEQGGHSFVYTDPQLHPVYSQTCVVCPHIQLCIQEHMLCTYRHNMYQMFDWTHSITYLTEEFNYKEGQSNNVMIQNLMFEIVFLMGYYIM